MTDQDSHFPGFGITGYRNFVGEISRFYPWTKINIVMGRNNAGKSNLLAATRLVCSGGLDGHISERDSPRRHDDAQFAVRLAVRKILSSTEYVDFGQLGKERMTTPGQIWCDFQWIPPKNSGSAPEIRFTAECIEDLSKSIRTLEHSEIRRSLGLGGGSYTLFGSAQEVVANYFLEAFRAQANVSIPVELCLADRSAGTPAQTTNNRNQSGVGQQSASDPALSLARTLYRLVNPEPDRTSKALLERYRGFLRFASDVLGIPILAVTFPTQDRLALIGADGHSFYLEHMGSGVEQALLLGAAVALSNASIICIEEPENSLHPRALRCFLDYISNVPDKQFVITTHSTVFLSANPNDSISFWHVSERDGAASVELALGPRQVEAIRDLGALPSDLMQTNFVIWVEGPSDRIYLKAWIDKYVEQCEEPFHHLREGIEYSFLFTGGSVLFHFDGSEDAGNGSADPEKIPMRRHGQSFAVVMDSDRQNPDEGLKERVESIAKALGSSGFPWVTGPKEVEGYVANAHFFEAGRAAHPSVTALGTRTGKNSEWFKTSSGTLGKPDKVAIAKHYAAAAKGYTWSEICDEAPNAIEVGSEGGSDLRKRIGELVQLIEEANT